MNKLTVLMSAFLVAISIASIGTAAEIIVKLGKHTVSLTVKNAKGSNSTTKSGI